jgi:hypothetical protein
MTRTAFRWSDPALAGVAQVTAYHRLPRALTPLVTALLPEGIVRARTGKLIALAPFELDGAAYGGLIGPVTEAARAGRLALQRRHGLLEPAEHEPATGHGAAVMSNTTRCWNITAFADAAIEVAARCGRLPSPQQLGHA